MIAKDVAHLHRQAGTYVLFGTDGQLSLAQPGGPPVPLAHLPGISTEGQIKLYVHEPWVCVTERFGTHAVLVHLENASVREMRRTDYHANVSTYSIGFLERNGRVLLIHQTEWNRLDIMDAVTGECLTDREVYLRKVEPGRGFEGEEYELPGYEQKNYIDYFHSLLHVSPDGEHFLSNGWMWHPLGQIICFRTDEFLQRYEPSKVAIDDLAPYNWDRPCAFIGNNRFVVAADDLRKNGWLDDEDLEDCGYKELLFYQLDVPATENRYGEYTLARTGEASCSAFSPDRDGCVYGELVWDAEYKFLAAVTPDGAFAIHLDGEVLESLPECKWQEGFPFANPISQNSQSIGWHYNPERHVLYRWSQEADRIEERRFSCAVR